jgi:YfiH family protein
MTRAANLPVPGAGFRWSHEVWGDALRCLPLEAIAQHLFTTRQLQLRPFERQSAAWMEAAAAVGGSPERLARIKQVHGHIVHVVDSATPGSTPEPPEADAIASNQSGALLAVQVADCVPLLMADRRRGVAAAVHAGWRGTAKGVAREAVEALCREFDVKPSDLVAAIGPSIGPCCYQVGPELRDAFRANGASEDRLARWFSLPGGSWRLDLWLANVDQLTAAGIPERQIYVARLCTQSHSDLFDSYRAQGPDAGRMAALIRVP